MNWVRTPEGAKEQAVYFQKEITWKGPPCRVEAKVTALGVYNLLVNGKKIGRQLLTPGWTSYNNRIFYQTYDVTRELKAGGLAAIEVGRGWAVGTLGYHVQSCVYSDHMSCAAELIAYYEDGTEERVTTGTDWLCYSHPVQETDIYNGETWDGTFTPQLLGPAAPNEKVYSAIPQEGEWIMPQERLKPVELIVTPRGERVLDFGQNLTGFVELQIQGKRGEVIAFDHAEVLDKEGNFYRENYRSAKAYARFVLSGEQETLAPHFTFYGFRYIRLLEYPGDTVSCDAFTAVAVHSDMKRTGDFSCGHELLNRLYHNIIWGQKSNYLDIPTDCPQRDERLGWTGDAQVFCRTAAINFDVEKFFMKWLTDMMLEQREDGAVGGVYPIAFPKDVTRVSAAWGDAACICPYEIWRAYGNDEVLRRFFPMMKKWVDYQHSAGKEEFLWLDGTHYGDWLGMDAGDGIYEGATPTDMIATAFFAHSCDLLVKAGEILGEDMGAYRALYAKVVEAFRASYIEDGRPVRKGAALTHTPSPKEPPVINPDTQTACVLILHFNLCTEEDRPRFAKRLAELVREHGAHLTTGFVGTPYLLHALSENGYAELAYDLLLQETFPSWLFSVKQGATTMWEHWDGIKEDGSFWSAAMNSYNHYAYGAVYDWIFGAAAGVQVDEDGAGYRKVTIRPLPDARLGRLTASTLTRQGKLLSHWEYREGKVFFRFEIPAGTTAQIVLPDGRTYTVSGGIYQF